MDEACTFWSEATAALTFVLCCIRSFKCRWWMSWSSFCFYQENGNTILICMFYILNLFHLFSVLCPVGVELQLRMAGDSRVLMDHNMEIGVTPAQVNCTATTGPALYSSLPYPQWGKKWETWYTVFEMKVVWAQVMEKIRADSVCVWERKPDWRLSRMLRMRKLKKAIRYLAGILWTFTVIYL